MWLFPRRIAWGRNDLVRDGDLAQSGLSDEPGVFEVGVGLAVDLQIDFTHGGAFRRPWSWCRRRPLRRAGAFGYRPAIYDFCIDRLCRRPDHCDGGVEH